MQIKSVFDHYNFNVLDLERSIAFYEKALGLKEIRRKTADDNSFILVFMGDGTTGFSLELTYMRDRKEAYDLGEGEYHLCMRLAGDYDEVRAFHREMGCICYENEKMGLYFISDPDGYWIEILPLKK
jgi:lactoylglutathione lyase